jgi:hypothetical protein
LNRLVYFKNEVASFSVKIYNTFPQFHNSYYLKTQAGLQNRQLGPGRSEQSKRMVRGIEKEVVKKYSNRKKVKQTMHELLQIGLDATSRPSPEAKPDLNRAVLFLR